MFKKWACVFVAILFIYSLWYMMRELKHLRDESECRDIMEAQVVLLAQIISQNPSSNSNPDPALMRTISGLRYFPDYSGNFFVMDYQGNLYCHGEFNYVGVTDLTKAHNLPFHLPHDDLIAVARQGGGYARYDWQGRQKLAFVFPVKNTNLFIGSGLCVDHASQHRRRGWKTEQRIKPRLIQK